MGFPSCCTWVRTSASDRRARWMGCTNGARALGLFPDTRFLPLATCQLISSCPWPVSSPPPAGRQPPRAPRATYLRIPAHIYAALRALAVAPRDDADLNSHHLLALLRGIGVASYPESLVQQTQHTCDNAPHSPYSCTASENSRRRCWWCWCRGSRGRRRWRRRRCRCRCIFAPSANHSHVKDNEDGQKYEGKDAVHDHFCSLVPCLHAPKQLLCCACEAVYIPHLAMCIPNLVSISR
jgi:hypothetical protein